MAPAADETMVTVYTTSVSTVFRSAGVFFAIVHEDIVCPITLRQSRAWATSKMAVCHQRE